MDETTPVASSERIAEDEPRRTDDRRVRRSSRSRSPRVGGSSSGAPRRRSRMPVVLCVSCSCDAFNYTSLICTFHTRHSLCAVHIQLGSPPPRRRPSRERRRRSRSRSRDYRRDGGHRRGGGGGRSRSRSRDRYRRRRSPSPEVPPISQWPRKLNNWDFQPPGYEHLTAQQAKMSGLFPVPGGSFRPTGAAAVTGVTTGGVPRRTDSGAQSAAGLGLPTSAVMAPRTQRRVYLGNLPPGVNDVGMVVTRFEVFCSHALLTRNLIQQRILVDWLNNLLQTNNSVKYAGNPCININVNYDRNFAFAEVYW